MALILVFLRAQDEVAWEATLSSASPNVNELLRELPPEISDHTGAAIRTLHYLPTSDLSDMINAVDSTARRLGNKAAFSHLLGEFAEYEGKRGGTFYTPKSVTEILANALDISSTSAVYDPFCRAGELLIAAAARTGAESASTGFSVYGATPNGESLSIARMYTQLNGLQAELRKGLVIDLGDDVLNARKFTHILTNPPFNLTDWGSRDSNYWRYGPPPKGNANFAWLQYIVEQLEPSGQAAVVMANGALSSANPRERDIRMGMVEDGCVEAIIALPPKLFYNTGIPATIWLLNPPRTSRDEILFVNASDSGHMVGRTHRDLSDAEIGEIVRVVGSWRSGRQSEGSVSAISVPVIKIREQGYNLNPFIYLSRSPGMTAHGDTMSEIRAITRRLESEQNKAAIKDAEASRLLNGLT